MCRRQREDWPGIAPRDRKSTRLNSSHVSISYAVFCLKKKKHTSMPITHVIHLQKVTTKYSLLTLFIKLDVFFLLLMNIMTNSLLFTSPALTGLIAYQ